MSPTTLHVFTRTVASPVGPLFLAASDAGLHAVEFAVHRHPVPRGDHWRDGAHPVLDAASRQLAEYFAGTRRRFDLPFAASGTPFQREVWAALTRIPYGTTASYVELARMVDAQDFGEAGVCGADAGTRRDGLLAHGLFLLS